METNECTNERQRSTMKPQGTDMKFFCYSVGVEST